MLNGTCFVDKVWLIDGFSDYIFRFQPVLSTQSDQRAAAGRWMTSQSCDCRMFETFGCFDMYLEVFVKEARIESVNAWVLCCPDNTIISTRNRNPITCRLHGKIWSQTNICRLIFIHKLVAQSLRSHMLCFPQESPAADCVLLTEAIYCNFTLLWGHQLHSYSFMFVWVHTVLGSQQISCLPVFYFFTFSISD